MHIILGILFVLAAWRWGDWENWRRYYSTIVFIILIDLFQNLLTYNYPLWTINPSFDRAILPNHTVISLFIMFVVYPAKVLIFLGNYPNRRGKQILYILVFVISFSIFESIVLLSLDLISYHNDWNVWWSVLLNFVMYPTIIVHHKRPIWAWIICTVFAIFIVYVFDIPIANMK